MGYDMITIAVDTRATPGGVCFAGKSELCCKTTCPMLSPQIGQHCSFLLLVSMIAR